MDAVVVARPPFSRQVLFSNLCNHLEHLTQSQNNNGNGNLWNKSFWLQLFGDLFFQCVQTLRCFQDMLLPLNYPLWSHGKLNLLVQQPNCKDFFMKKRLNHHSHRCAGISRVSNTNRRLYKDWERRLWKIFSFTSWDCVPISWAVIDALSSSSFSTAARVVITFYHFIACWRIRSFSKVPFFANPSCCWILHLQVMYITLFCIADLWPSVQVTNESLFS